MIHWLKSERVSLLIGPWTVSAWLFSRGLPQAPLLSPLGFVMSQQEPGLRLGKTNGDMMPPCISSANNDELWQHVCQHGQKQNIFMVLIVHRAPCWPELLIWGCFWGQQSSLKPLVNVQFSLSLLCLSGSFSLNRVGLLLQTFSPLFPPSHC